MAGRPRKNAALLEMSGATRLHPGRYEDRGKEPETKGPIGDPPEEFLRPHGDGPALAALWRKLVDEAPIGLLTLSDRETLATVCRVGIEAKRTGSKGYLRALEVYGKMLKGLGMTPEGRAIRGIGGKVSDAKKEGKLEAFRRGHRKAG